MNKSQAIDLLGGTATSAAAAIGISPQAISGWPFELTPAISDRVLAALARKHLPPELIGGRPTQPTPAEPATAAG